MTTCTAGARAITSSDKALALILKWPVQATNVEGEASSQLRSVLKPYV
jgi:hypothetical protein